MAMISSVSSAPAFGLSLALVIASAACRPSQPAPAAPAKIELGPPSSVRWPALDRSAPISRTEDGLAVIDLSAIKDPAKIAIAARIARQHRIEASDGERIYFALELSSHDGNPLATYSYADVLIRGDDVRLDVLQALTGLHENPGGCAAADRGTVLFSARTAISATAVAGRQAAWMLGPDGLALPFLMRSPPRGDSRCHARLDATGSSLIELAMEYIHRSKDGVDWRGSVGQFGIADFPSPISTGPFGDAERRFFRESLAGCDDRRKRTAATGEWAAAACDGRAARLHLGGQGESTKDAPVRFPVLSYEYGGYEFTNDTMAITAAGDVVVPVDEIPGAAGDPPRSGYAVWRAKDASFSPPRALSSSEHFAWSSPPILLRGLPSSD